MSKKKKIKKTSDIGIDLLDKDKNKDKIQKPSKYQVILHNDDFTPMELVVIILMTFYKKTTDEAWIITNQIHNSGKGIAGGPYSKEIADTKVHETNAYARACGYPLLSEAQKVD